MSLPKEKVDLYWFLFISINSMHICRCVNICTHTCVCMNTYACNIYSYNLFFFFKFDGQ